MRRSHRARPDRKSTTSELQSHVNLVCRLLLEKKKHLHHEQADRCVTVGWLHKQRHDPAKAALVFTQADRLLTSLVDRHPHEIPCFFSNDTATTEIYTLSLHDALPIRSAAASSRASRGRAATSPVSPL